MVTHLCKLPKAVFQWRPSHLIVPHCCWQCLLLVQSTTEIDKIPGFRDMADNAHILDQHNTFLQTSKGCFPVQTNTLDRSALLLAVATSTVDIWDSQYCRFSRYGRQRPLFSSTWSDISANFERQFSSSDHHTWSFRTVVSSAYFYSRQLRWLMLREFAENTNVLVRHKTFLQTSKDCFPVQTNTLDHSALFVDSAYFYSRQLR